MEIFDLLESQSGSGNINDSDKLFLIAKGGIEVLEREYKDLSDKGKFEVILFNALSVLKVYQKNHLSKYANTEEGFYKSIFIQANVYGINHTLEQLINFINNRFQLYSQELHNIFNKKGYTSGKIYAAFYLAPLEDDPDPSFDLKELLYFLGGLTTMIRWVYDNADEI